ncbi:hypothetical protein PCASD_03094 [Puccinia coronata f. sp. avenae]|uniref:Uncharacterized protein n=1 Tax=Puccinia coronata f. sp. avenae TaxID=200324 RepID=A0A2N5V5W8_9BASI|nr:hypothetical protein PCASD_03094 [Puccinia coronata f. sp. avenae]
MACQPDGTVPQQPGMRLVSADTIGMVDAAPLEPLLVSGELYLPTRLVSVDTSTDTGLWWVGTVPQHSGMARGLYPPLSRCSLTFQVKRSAQWWVQSPWRHSLSLGDCIYRPEASGRRRVYGH